jgi:hypothetical protein
LWVSLSPVSRAWPENFVTGRNAPADRIQPGVGSKQNKTCNQFMDTDELSREAYKAVIIEAEKLTHDLTLNFGVLSSQCKDEPEYLEKSKQLAIDIRKLNYKDLENVLFGNVPDINKLNNTLDKIISNIEKVNKVPIDNRHYDF